MTTPRISRKKTGYPGTLTDLHRFRKTAHGHDGSSRVVMVRKTDQRTFASMSKGQEPEIETIVRETVETFSGQRTECKVTTEKKNKEESCPPEILEALYEKYKKSNKKPLGKKLVKMDATKFENECLRTHNHFRKLHNVPPLKLNKEICKVSQNWANHLIRSGKLVNSKNEMYGENLFRLRSVNFSCTVTGEEVVRSWYKEMSDYKFDGNSSETGNHFTQMIWKASREIGIGFAKSGGTVIVVANYYPPGNFIGKFTENVLPLSQNTSENNNNYEKEKVCLLTKNISNLSLKSNASSRSQVVRNWLEGNFEQDFLEAHNLYRKRHGVEPLKLDRKMCRYAEEWAKYLAESNKVERRPKCDYGENLFNLSTRDTNYKLNGHTPVDSWYEGIKYHKFGKEPSDLKSGNFTQIIWKSSELLGVGVARNRNAFFVVANYSPPGNFIGSFVENCPAIRSITSINDEVIESEDAITKSEDFSLFALDCLKVHNEYRRKHRVPELKLKKKLCILAQEWAEHLLEINDIQHRPNNEYGENIFNCSSSDSLPSARDAVKTWYEENKIFPFGKETVVPGTFHFTQIIWKKTKEVGIGIATSKGVTFVVANYHPRGNILGEFVENVPPTSP